MEINAMNGSQPQQGGTKGTNRGAKIVLVALTVAALAGVVHYVKRYYAIQGEYAEAYTQCGQLFDNAAKRIAEKHWYTLSVGPVRVQRFIDRGNGPDTLDCQADVKIKGAYDEQPWVATGHPGKSFTLVSARVLGDEKVDEVLMNH